MGLLGSQLELDLIAHYEPAAVSGVLCRLGTEQMSAWECNFFCRNKHLCVGHDIEGPWVGALPSLKSHQHL